MVGVINVTVFSRFLHTALFGLLLGTLGCERPASVDAAAPDEVGPSINVPRPIPRPGGRWLLLGGGGAPDSTQVSIEQDVAYASRLLGPGGTLLFAGGAGSYGVQIQAEGDRGDALTRRLGDFFSPRAGRDATYRKTQLAAHGPATADEARRQVVETLARGDGPFLLYLAGHGDVGETPAQNGIGLWERSFLTVAELATLLDRSAGGRRTRVVVTTCYAGGFAEIVFVDGDPGHGVTSQDRCGLFATTWDLQASGCDPNPDRGAQEGYGLHLLRALDGRDLRGDPLVGGRGDLDGDGRLDLLEAHTLVRMTSAAPDVPTTTSERWLRHAAGGLPDAGRQQTIPEEAAVIAALSKRLGVHRLDQVRAILERQELGADDVQAQIKTAEEEEMRAFRRAEASLLSRWPVLDDPWHPEFAALIARSRDAIAEHLDTASELEVWRAARARIEGLDRRFWEGRREAAPWERLMRAMENQQLLARLKRKGGEDLAVYERLRACERSLP